MAISKTTTETCKHCDDQIGDFYSPGYCSEECYGRYRRSRRANHVLELLEHDHRFCSTCFAQLKVVDKPAFKSVVIPPSRHDEDWGNASDVFVGYQDRTEHAETGEISLDVDDDADRPIVEDGVATGTICSCGQTDHRDVDPTIRSSLWTDKILRQLVDAIATLEAEDKHDVEVDDGRLFEHGLETDDVRGALEEAVILDE